MGTFEALQRADAVVSVSQNLAGQVECLGIDRSKIHVIYNGVDGKRFTPGSRLEARRQLGIPEDEKTILYVGNLVPIKGLEVLVEACSILAKSGQSFSCHLIGNGPLRRKLERQSEWLRIDNRLHFHGSISQQQLPAWYRAADLVVLASYSEGLPNVLLEAIACGIPFVATRVGGIPELKMPLGSDLVNPGSPSELAVAISHCLRNTQIESSSKLPVRSYSRVGEEFTLLFESVLKRSSALEGANVVCSHTENI
jgi:glycosyltransferase involved in cell wall biosynthesis